MSQTRHPTKPVRPHIQIDIWSDIACPWCHIGKRRLEAALAQFPHREEVSITWHSFELDPNAAVSANQNSRDHLAQKYGVTPERAQDMQDNMTATAAAEGLDFHFDTLKLTNTFNAHQLVHLAATHGLQDAMKERLFRAYLEEGQHLGNTDTLVKLAEQTGLDAHEAQTALEQQTYAHAVRHDETRAHAYGINSVPFFVLNDKYGVSGAQSAEVFLSALEQVWQEQQPEAPTT